jgi:hypothetical protein
MRTIASPELSLALCEKDENTPSAARRQKSIASAQSRAKFELKWYVLYFASEVLTMDYPEKEQQAYDKVKDEHGIAIHRAEVPYPVHGDRWGHWEFDAERLVLMYEHGRHEYEVDLEDMTTSAGMLDWIFQVNTKGWASREEIGDLVQALDDLLRPQANLCSGGMDKKFHPAKYIREHLRTGQRHNRI